MSQSLQSDPGKPIQSQPCSHLAVACFTGFFLLFAVPFFLRMPLTNDTLFYDLQTRMFSEGHVPYRDILEPNWPGVFWIHALVRDVLGPSSEAMRFVDLFGVLALSWMLKHLAQLAGTTRNGASWISLALLAFYLSCSEWCHCQRDTWLLILITAASCLRLRRVNSNLLPRVYDLAAIGEGFLWGGAVWLKPYAALIAVSVWLVALPRFSTFRRALSDTGLVLSGALSAGAGGFAWLVQTGAWPFWLQTMREWNPRYLAAGREHWVAARFLSMLSRMQPWYCLHVLAMPLALSELVRWVQLARQQNRVGTTDPPGLTRALLAVTYLATMAHVFLLQHLFDYVHAPTILLAIIVVGIWVAQPRRARRWHFVAVVFGVIVAMHSPLLRPQRVRLWWTCATLPINASWLTKATLQDKLALLPNPHRVHLERVAEFLSRQKPDRKAINLINSDLIALYERLDVRPPTRFVYVWELLLYFPQQRAEIMTELAKSGHQFVVSDLVSCGMAPADAWEVGPLGPHAPPPKFPIGRPDKYPWSHQVVFRSGPYMVHEVSGPLGKPAAP